MNFNPFEQKAKSLESCLMSFKDLSPKPYNKLESSPYTRVRCILMNGTEYESVWFGHQFHRHSADNDLRRTIALIRRNEQQQQKLISSLKPVDENLLETTIGYEQLAVDLTAFLAQHVSDENVKAALDFALLEDFDHLYRYANMLESDMGAKAEDYVGDYTEIMPARPTISHHRHPFFYKNQKGREVYTEIAMVEEQHVTQYGSLIDPTASWFEMCLMHEYIECYLYYSMMCDESEENVKKIWERLLEQEISHLHAAAKNLKKYEKKEWQEVIPNGNFPELISFKSNKHYIRDVIKNTVCNTANRESYININKLPKDADFFKYQNKVIKNPKDVASHKIIEEHIERFGEDYRVQDKEHPIKELQDRTVDNMTVGRSQN